jgi:hypothetical protein
VLDENTIVFPHLPGNQRFDTFLDLFQSLGVGLLLLIPGKGETHENLIRKDEEKRL